MFCRKGVLKNFATFTGEHLCLSLFTNKVAGLRPYKRDSDRVCDIFNPCVVILAISFFNRIPASGIHIIFLEKLLDFYLWLEEILLPVFEISNLLRKFQKYMKRTSIIRLSFQPRLQRIFSL